MVRWECQQCQLIPLYMYILYNVHYNLRPEMGNIFLCITVQDFLDSMVICIFRQKITQNELLRIWWRHILETMAIFYIFYGIILKQISKHIKDVGHILFILWRTGRFYWIIPITYKPFFLFKFTYCFLKLWRLKGRLTGSMEYEKSTYTSSEKKQE